jgi:hypothetical protein
MGKGVKQWIFAHRGDWNNQVAPNSELSIRNAFHGGFGVETDIRDLNGEIVISHDPCVGNSYKKFSDFIDMSSRIAINIKSDGLVELFQDYAELIRESESFVFDCSFPELIKFKKAGIPHAIRISEYEKELAWKPDYIWLDCFESDWWLEDTSVLEIMKVTPTVAVSPELHGREHAKVWQRVIQLRSEGLNLSVCTDFPNELAILAGLA